MTTISSRSFIAPFWVAILFCCVGVGETRVFAAELKLQAQLVWGTNQDRVQDQTELEPKLRAKLRNIFRWKNYFEVNRKPFSLPGNGTQKVSMSDDCSLEVKHLGGNNLEVKLIGKGSSVVTKRQAIARGESIVLAGPDKNDTAWFVVLSLAADK